jgi:hypothetical protein
MEGQKVITSQSGKPIAVLSMVCVDGKSFLLRPIQTDHKIVVAFRRKVTDKVLNARSPGKTTVDNIADRIEKLNKLLPAESKKVEPAVTHVCDARPTNVRTRVQTPDRVIIAGGNSLERDYVAERSKMKLLQFVIEQARLDRKGLHKPEQTKRHRDHDCWKMHRRTKYRYPKPSFRTLEPELVDREVDLW